MAPQFFAIARFVFPVVFFLLMFACETSLVKIHRAYPRSSKAKFESTARTMTNDRDCFFSLCRYLPDLSKIFIKKEAWFYSIPATLLVGMCGIFPLLVIPVESGRALREGVSADRLKLLLSFAVGGLLGDVFLHLLPEAWAHVDPGDHHNGHMKIGLWVIIGILSFLILEKIFGEGEDDNKKTTKEESETTDKNIEPKTKESHKMANGKRKNGHVTNGTVTSADTKSINGTVKNGYIAAESDVRQRQIRNQHKTDEKHETLTTETDKDTTITDNQPKSEEHIKVMGYLNLMANCIDNFTHGLAVAGSFVVSRKVGMCTTCAIFLHEIPHEVGDFAILLKSGFRRWDAAIAQVITASWGLVGAVVGLLAEHAGDSTAFILPFSSGGFIYIAMVTIVPELLQEKRPRESIKQTFALLAGIASMGIVSLLH